jgi:hypothetical protein
MIDVIEWYSFATYMHAHSLYGQYGVVLLGGETMGISHPNIDVGAEADTYREAFGRFENIATKDEHNDQTNVTTIEYVSGEGDPPFIKYRLTLEAIALVSPAEYDTLKHPAKAAE